MNHRITNQPSYSFLHVELEPGDQIKTEAGAMVYMDPDLDVDTKFGSGILSAISRKFLGGESFFFNIFSAKQKGKLGIAPSLPGDILHMNLTGNHVIVQAGSYLASDPDIEMKSKFGGIKSLFGGEGAFLLDISGNGNLWLNAYGAIIEIDIDGEYTLDTGHLVAFESTLDYELKKVGSWKSTLLSGEGLVFKFKGQGKLYIQSRVPSGFVGWLQRLLPG